MTNKLNENSLAEQPLIEWLKALGYDYEFGPDLAPGGAYQERDSFQEVLLLPRLRRSLRRLNPNLPDEGIEEAIRELNTTAHPTLVFANKAVYEKLVRGVTIEVREDERLPVRDTQTGGRRPRHVRFIDFEHPESNEFLAVRQFAIAGAEEARRPDVALFINGIPVVVFELKSPVNETATIGSAVRQIDGYKKDIPELFKYNQFVVVSDLRLARHGTISSSLEWFAVWKDEKGTTEKHRSELETLVSGMCGKERFLDIIRHFIAFEADSEDNATTFIKKMAKYHQYFGVNTAIEETVRAARPGGNKKIGVFWHTQGSGKTLSMVFYVNKARELSELRSPTFLFLTDRKDLDDQIYKTFLRTGYAPLTKHIESVADLKKKLREAGGEVVFTTIQKFETEKEQLSLRENVLVVADEAHRSQYAKFAGNVREALPNAAFMGITGTPISLQDRDTRLVFGKDISVYTITQAVDDKAVVKIYYEGRMVPLHLTNEFIDEEFEKLTTTAPMEGKEALKRKWARLEELVGAPDRLDKIAADIVSHFNGRGLEGKAMVVTMSRRIAAEMYARLRKEPNVPECAVVISNPEEFAGKIQSEMNVKELERRFKKPDDPLRLAIVCDMWLTGFDVPHLHTMYLDKPLKNHTLMQAIARVNRIYKDKPAGLVVDYIGVADYLKKALAVYASEYRQEAMFPLEDAIAKMLEEYDIVRGILSGLAYEGWRRHPPVELARLLQDAVGKVLGEGEKTDTERVDRFLKHAEQLSKLHALVMPHTAANDIRNEVAFFRAVKHSVRKYTSVGVKMEGALDPAVETAIRELISQGVAAEGVIDIFATQGKEKPEISVFDEKFIEEIKKMRSKNLAAEVLKKLLRDELRVRRRKNVARYQSLMDLLDEIIEEYENNMLNSSQVIERLLELARDVKLQDTVGLNLGFSPEELAFYDALSKGKKELGKNEELKELVKELVKIVHRDTAVVDWKNNDVIKARLRASVKLLLLQKGFTHEETETALQSIYEQAKELFEDFVPLHSF